MAGAICHDFSSPCCQLLCTVLGQASLQGPLSRAHTGHTDRKISATMHTMPHRSSCIDKHKLLWSVLASCPPAITVHVGRTDCTRCAWQPHTHPSVAQLQEHALDHARLTCHRARLTLAVSKRGGDVLARLLSLVKERLRCTHTGVQGFVTSPMNVDICLGWVCVYFGCPASSSTGKPAVGHVPLTTSPFSAFPRSLTQPTATTASTTPHSTFHPSHTTPPTPQSHPAPPSTREEPTMISVKLLSLSMMMCLARFSMSAMKQRLA